MYGYSKKIVRLHFGNAGNWPEGEGRYIKNVELSFETSPKEKKIKANFLNCVYKILAILVALLHQSPKVGRLAKEISVTVNLQTGKQANNATITKPCYYLLKSKIIKMI